MEETCPYVFEEGVNGRRLTAFVTGIWGRFIDSSTHVDID